MQRANKQRNILSFAVRNKHTVKKLTQEERESALKKLSTWKYNAQKDAIEKQFVFENFNQAWGFMNRVALKAEQVKRESDI